MVSPICWVRWRISGSYLLPKLVSIVATFSFGSSPSKRYVSGKRNPSRRRIGRDIGEEVELGAVDVCHGFQKCRGAAFAAQTFVLFGDLLDPPAFENGDVKRLRRRGDSLRFFLRGSGAGDAVDDLRDAHALAQGVRPRHQGPSRKPELTLEQELGADQSLALQLVSDLGVRSGPRRR